MTPDQSKKLKTGQRVGWLTDPDDLGTIAETSWSAVHIKWDSGKTQELHHNDMGDVTMAGPPTTTRP
jgi:hypothetical protein